MDENQNREETVRIEKHECFECRHPLLKAILCGLLIFLGAYCASYVVTDWHMKSLMSHMMRPFPPRMDRMIQKDMKAMNNLWKEDMSFARKAANVIHMEQTKDAYKIIIDLRAFDNNENNVQVTANGNILTINGRSIRKSKNNEQISEFQQNYMFGENVQLKNLTKETEGNYYVVTIPIGEKED